VGHNPSAAPSARGSCAASKYAKETVRNQRKGLGIFCYITQNQVVATSCWFESGQGHQSEIVTLLCLFQQFEAHLKFWRGKHRVSTQLNLVPSIADGPFNIRCRKQKFLHGFGPPFLAGSLGGGTIFYRTGNDVRFATDSGRESGPRDCPLSATSGLMHYSKRRYFTRSPRRRER
jgi:hypothetical protein